MFLLVITIFLHEVTSLERYSLPVDSFSFYDTVDIESLSFDKIESPRHTTISSKKTTSHSRNKVKVTC